MRLRKLKSFDDDLIQLSKPIQEAARKQYHQFKQDPRHPSLRVKKMKGHEGIWEGHVTRGYVFTFHWDSDPETGEQIAVFRRIGTHAVYDKP